MASSSIFFSSFPHWALFWIVVFKSRIFFFIEKTVLSHHCLVFVCYLTLILLPNLCSFGVFISFVAHLIYSYFLFCFFISVKLTEIVHVFFLVFVLTEITNRLCFQSKHISALRIQFRLVDNTNVENCPR